MAREAASRERARLESALDGAGDPFIVSDLDGRIVFANRAYRTLLAADAPRTVAGAPLRDVIRAEATHVKLDTLRPSHAAAAEFMNRAMKPGTTSSPSSRTAAPSANRAERTSEGGLVMTRTDLTDQTRLERDARGVPRSVPPRHEDGGAGPPGRGHRARLSTTC